MATYQVLFFIALWVQPICWEDQYYSPGTGSKGLCTPYATCNCPPPLAKPYDPNYSQHFPATGSSGVCTLQGTCHCPPTPPPPTYETPKYTPSIYEKEKYPPPQYTPPPRKYPPQYTPQYTPPHPPTYEKVYPPPGSPPVYKTPLYDPPWPDYPKKIPVDPPKATCYCPPPPPPPHPTNTYLPPSVAHKPDYYYPQYDNPKKVSVPPLPQYTCPCPPPPPAKPPPASPIPNYPPYPNYPPDAHNPNYPSIDYPNKVQTPDDLPIRDPTKHIPDPIPRPPDSTSVNCPAQCNPHSNKCHIPTAQTCIFRTPLSKPNTTTPTPPYYGEDYQPQPQPQHQPPSYCACRLGYRSQYYYPAAANTPDMKH
ncbi:hypothetical protein B0H66DRAFT_606303 [Apodospora peruviana]|uniref:Uncharacterized protein n=1 Tax=Apodospora peruviana TaxID=516989 RepID=A0AAE0M157_9PEZI|nr:hypothetical protein B0H66DRAFT_606303 [Apodospora peruviana]